MQRLVLVMRSATASINSMDDIPRRNSFFTNCSCFLVHLSRFEPVPVSASLLPSYKARLMRFVSMHFLFGLPARNIAREQENPTISRVAYHSYGFWNRRPMTSVTVFYTTFSFQRIFLFLPNSCLPDRRIFLSFYKSQH